MGPQCAEAALGSAFVFKSDSTHRKVGRTAKFLGDLDRSHLCRLTLCGVLYADLWRLELTRDGICSAKSRKNSQSLPPSPEIAAVARTCVEEITCPWTNGTPFAAYIHDIAV